MFALFLGVETFDSLFDFSHSDEVREKIFKQLRLLLQPFLLRRLKITAAKEIPPKTESIFFSKFLSFIFKSFLHPALSLERAAHA